MLTGYDRWREPPRPSYAPFYGTRHDRSCIPRGPASEGSLIAVAPPSAWLTDPEYAALRHRLEAAHAAAEAALVEARRSVRLNEG